MIPLHTYLFIPLPGTVEIYLSSIHTVRRCYYTLSVGNLWQFQLNGMIWKRHTRLKRSNT